MEFLENLIITGWIVLSPSDESEFTVTLIDIEQNRYICNVKTEDQFTFEVPSRLWGTSFTIIVEDHLAGNLCHMAIFPLEPSTLVTKLPPIMIRPSHCSHMHSYSTPTPSLEGWNIGHTNYTESMSIGFHFWHSFAFLLLFVTYLHLLNFSLLRPWSSSRGRSRNRNSSSRSSSSDRRRSNALVVRRRDRNRGVDGDVGSETDLLEVLLTDNSCTAVTTRGHRKTHSRRNR